MKKMVFFVVLVMAVVGSCAAQSVTNEAQKLVGTWVGEYRGQTITLVLNADGTGTQNGERLFWGVSASGGLSLGNEGAPFYFSPDGRRMIWNSTVWQKR